MGVGNGSIQIIDLLGDEQNDKEGRSDEEWRSEGVFM